MDIIIASNNLNKIKEIKTILNNEDINLLSLNDIKFNEEIIESGKTFKENAYIKAKTIYDIYKTNVLADDSGLEVYALNMAPGVYSHRYAGNMQDDNLNNLKLIENLKGISLRGARYNCTLCFISEIGEVKYFEGFCEGEIIDNKKGENGFGYDPYFYIKELNKTMAELTLDEKNKISHRGKAIKDFRKYILSRL